MLYKDGRCGKVELTGFPLGIFEDVTYDEWGVTLEQGNIVVFHSDGIAETSNSEGQFFGTERLRKIIEAHNAVGAISYADLEIQARDVKMIEEEGLTDDTSVIDEIVQIDSQTSLETARHVARLEAVIGLVSVHEHLGGDVLGVGGGANLRPDVGVDTPKKVAVDVLERRPVGSQGRFIVFRGTSVEATSRRPRM